MLEIIKKNKQGFITLFILMFVGVSALYGANDFSNIDTVVEEADVSARKNVGTGAKWFFGMLPLIVAVVGIFLGYKQGKKKSEQEQEDATKPVIWAVGGAVVGAIAGLLIVALLGALLVQDSAKGLGVTKLFWEDVLDIIG